MILDDQIFRARAVHADRKKRLAAIRTRKQAEAYRDDVSDKIATCFGKFPRKTHLKAEVIGTLDFPKFRIEKVVFSSRPGLLVTANLYLPKGLRGPAPALLGNPGHEQNGKANEGNQAYAQEMVQSGFVVLVFDPLAQGERDQYPGLPKDHILRNNSAQAHSTLGQQLQLTGGFLGTWMVWDGMRALDYLLSRPEVDPGRIATTGSSGGGCLSTYLWALERRISATAPSCWVNSFLAIIENEVGGDAEQLPPGALEKGLEHGDFFLARVPEPALIIGQKHDFFDRRSFLETSAEVSRIYRLFGAEDQFGHFMGGSTHDYTPEARNAMRRFLCRHFAVTPPKKFSLSYQQEEKLLVVPGGNVVRHGGRLARELFHEGLVVPEKSWSVADLRKAIRRVLHLPARKAGPVAYRNLRGDWLPGDQLFGRYALATEPRYEAILRKVIAPAIGLIQALSVEKEVLLYLPHWSCHHDFIRVPAAKKLLDQLPVYAVEVRGLGESMCRDKPDGEVHFWMDYLAHSFDELLGRSLLGRRVFDLLRTCDLLAQEGASRIRLVGRGQGALIAAFAAALDPRIISAELHEAPHSFAEWLDADTLDWSVANCPPGVLRIFDLPAVYQTFSRQISVVSSWKSGVFPPHFED